MKFPLEMLFRSRKRRRELKGFSMFELLIVTLAIGVLVGLLLPAVDQAREAARRGACQNKLQQFSIAIHQFESTQGRLPSAWLPTATGTDGWSVHSQVLPFLELGSLYSELDFSKTWKGVQIPYKTTTLTSLPIESIPMTLFHCPSTPVVSISQTNYVVNRGTWVMWNPKSKKGGNGPFISGAIGVPLSDVQDGLGQTIAIGEVGNGLGFLQNSMKTKETLPIRSIDDQASLGGTLVQKGGHLSWMNGQAVETGFTASGVFGAQNWINLKEGSHPTAICYAIIYASSNHAGGFQVGYLDGSCHFISNSIDPIVYQSMMTRSGDEIQSISTQ